MLGDQTLFLSQEAHHYRWFLLPNEAQEWLLGNATTMSTTTQLPFTPRHYSTQSLNDLKTTGTEEEKEKQRQGREEVRKVKFHCPPKDILKPVMEVSK